MTNDLGIVLLTLENTRVYDSIFASIQNMIKQNPYKQICVFNSKNNRIETGNVPILHLSQAKFFSGNLLIFDTLSLLFAKNFVSVNKIYFYVSDFLWTGQQYSNYYEVKNLFDTKNLEFIARDEQTSDIYEICWKKPITISKDINYESLKQIL